MKKDLIDQIVTREWDQFTNTVNLGKRAYCQDNKNIFFRSRRAYLDIYPEEILESYLSDLEVGQAKGVSLVTQKYGYMMEYTDPDYFDQIKLGLMPLSEKKINLVESIMLVYLDWLKEIGQREANTGQRPLFAQSDRVNSTSVETYMRGELRSYSDQTLIQILGYFLSQLAGGKNLAMVNLNNLRAG